MDSFPAECQMEILKVLSRFLHKVYDRVVGDLMLNMLRSEKLSNDELDQLESMIAQARKHVSSVTHCEQVLCSG